jgi:hypothetical protein
MDGLSVFGAGPDAQQVADLAVCSPNLRRSERCANARLIAQAPELLACCRQLLAVIDRHPDQECAVATLERLRVVVAAADGHVHAAPRVSGQPCGCDPAAGWTCEQHRDSAATL